MLVQGNPPNYFDPANGFVPTGPLNKTLGTTVTISGSATEFGYADGANTINANFGGSILTITDVSSGGSLPITFIFTDSAFDQLTLISETFPGTIERLSRPGC